MTTTDMSAVEWTLHIGQSRGQAPVRWQRTQRFATKRALVSVMDLLPFKKGSRRIMRKGLHEYVAVGDLS